MSRSRLGQMIAERKGSHQMNCPACHLVHPEGARFCLNCGGALATTCPHCGTTLVPGAEFCHNYGYALATPHAPNNCTQACIQQHVPEERSSNLHQLETDKL